MGPWRIPKVACFPFWKWKWASFYRKPFVFNCLSVLPSASLSKHKKMRGRFKGPFPKWQFAANLERSANSVPLYMSIGDGNSDRRCGLHLHVIESPFGPDNAGVLTRRGFVRGNLKLALGIVFFKREFLSRQPGDARRRLKR